MNPRPAIEQPAAQLDVIAQAHARSRSSGLHAHEAPDFNPLRQNQLLDLVDRNQSLYSHALPVMETLHAQIVDTQSMVLLTDSNGVILHSLGNSDFIEKARRVALCPGVSWAEADRGTNAIGTALVDEQPTVVHGSEHFLRANRILTCSCAPIVDPYGHTIGALDVSGDTGGFHKQTLALVRMSTQIIENHLFANQFADAVRVRFHARAEFIGTLFEGLAAFAPDGRFLSANRSALFQFGRPLAALDGLPFEALFGASFAALVSEAERAPGQCTTLTLPSGMRVIARTECRTRTAFMSSRFDPRRNPPATNAAASARDGAVQDIAEAGRATHAEYRAVTFATLDTGDEKMADVLRRVGKIRGRDIPLLILGKTGTGKEWLARALHHESPRRTAPFVAVNCTSLPETLIEAELFGYEEGAFTGARKRGNTGKIVQANGGTLFLDEIGDMPIAQQVRLMRVLQERCVVPLGGARAIPVDVRVVCATHRNLREMIDAGTFREDLYYRINGLAVTLPALSERTDLAALVEIMLAGQRRTDARVPSRVRPEVLELFARCRWPGNLRQLSNVLRTAGVMAEDADAIGIEHLPEDFLDDHDALKVSLAFSSRALRPAVRMTEWQAELIEQTLARHGGNISAAARELGLARNTVYRYLRLRGAH